MDPLHPKAGLPSRQQCPGSTQQEAFCPSFSDLNSSLPAEIEKLFKCEEVNLAGVLGSVLATVSNTDLLSALDLGSILNMEGGGLGDILGQGSSGNSKGTDLLGGLLPLGDEGLGGLLGSGGKGKGTVKGLLEGTGLSSLQQPLDDVVGKATDLKESARNVMNKALPPDVSDALTNMLGGLDLDELLLG